MARAEQATRHRVSWRFGALLTTAMALSMLPLFLLGALGPYLVRDFGIARPLLGVLVTVGFGVAAVLSLLVGPTVAAIGPRRCLIALFAASAVVLAGFAVAPAYGLLVVAVALSGVPQALANPATNQLIAAEIPADQRGSLTGLKQSGVQLGAFLAGLPLAGIASVASWRLAVGLASLSALAAALGTLSLPADPAPPRRPRLASLTRPRGTAAWLCGFSVLLGAGIAAVNTYVALYATQELRMPVAVASVLVAALGIAGIVGRVGWSKVAARARTPVTALPPLTFGAVLAALALIAATQFGTGWAWVGVVGVGSCAVSANAVSMVAVITGAAPDKVAQDSAVVSAGFFAGFAIGPPVFGLLVDAAAGHYQAGWSLVGIEFLAAGTVAWIYLALNARTQTAPVHGSPRVSGLTARWSRQLGVVATAVGGIVLAGVLFDAFEAGHSHNQADDHRHGAAPVSPRPQPPLSSPAPPVAPKPAEPGGPLPAVAPPNPPTASDQPTVQPAVLAAVSATRQQQLGAQASGEPLASASDSGEPTADQQDTTTSWHQGEDQNSGAHSSSHRHQRHSKRPDRRRSAQPQDE